MEEAPSFERFLPSNPGRSFGCSTLPVVGFFICLSVVGASPASAPGSSSSQMSSTYPTVWYVGIGATIAAAAIGVIGLGVKLYRYFHRREGGDSERGDSLRDVLDALTCPFRERAFPMDVHMNVGRVNVREASLDNLRFSSSPWSSSGSSSGSSPI